jgi:hypothetical protein
MKSRGSNRLWPPHPYRVQQGTRGTWSLVPGHGGNCAHGPTTGTTTGTRQPQPTVIPTLGKQLVVPEREAGQNWSRYSQGLCQPVTLRGPPGSRPHALSPWGERRNRTSPRLTQALSPSRADRVRSVRWRSSLQCYKMEDALSRPGPRQRPGEAFGREGNRGWGEDPLYGLQFPCVLQGCKKDDT